MGGKAGAERTGGAGGLVGAGGVAGVGGAVGSGGRDGTGGTGTGGGDVGGAGTGGASTGGTGTGGASTGGTGTGGTGTGGAGTGGTGTGGMGTGGMGTGGMGTGGAGTGGAQCTPPAVDACTLGATQCLSATSLQTCSTATNGCAANVTTACPAALLCERHAPADCVDPAWAEWPMPNGPGDVTAGAPNPEAYTDNGDGTITDLVTALMWQKEVAPGSLTWVQAVAYCRDTLNAAGLGGHDDWRLPTRIELVSLIETGRLMPAIDTTYFPTPPSTIEFWSSSPVAGPSPPEEAWYVPFDYGGTYPFATSNPGHARCVR
jgi:hypothetical protein